MASGFATPHQLDGLVAGKRRDPRRAVRLEVRIKGAQGEFRAEARDLSPGGALLLLEVAELVGAEEAERLDASRQFALVDQQFSQNFDIQFVDQPVVVEAQLVRLTFHTEGEGCMGLGCRFQHPLSPKQAEALGVAGSVRAGPNGEDNWQVSIGVHDVRREPKRDRPVSAMIVDEHEAGRGPLFLGPVLQAGRRAVVVHLDGLDMASASEHLGSEGLRLRLRTGTEELFEAEGALVAVRYVDAPRPGTAVLFALDAPMAARCWRRFRRS